MAPSDTDTSTGIVTLVPISNGQLVQDLEAAGSEHSSADRSGAITVVAVAISVGGVAVLALGIVLFRRWKRAGEKQFVHWNTPRAEAMAATHDQATTRRLSEMEDGASPPPDFDAPHSALVSNRGPDAGQPRALGPFSPFGGSEMEWQNETLCGPITTLCDDELEWQNEELTPEKEPACGMSEIRPLPISAADRDRFFWDTEGLRVDTKRSPHRSEHSGHASDMDEWDSITALVEHPGRPVDRHGGPVGAAAGIPQTVAGVQQDCSDAACGSAPRASAAADARGDPLDQATFTITSPLRPHRRFQVVMATPPRDREPGSVAPDESSDRQFVSSDAAAAAASANTADTDGPAEAEAARPSSPEPELAAYSLA